MSRFDSLAQYVDSKEHLGFKDSASLAETMEYVFEDEWKYNRTRGIQDKETDNMPEDAYNLIRKFMDKAEALKGPENYDKQAVSSDLARACAAIPVETPEMAVKLMKTTSELFEMKTYGNSSQYFQLETFAKQGRFLGDKKVAETYLDVTSKSFEHMKGFSFSFDEGIDALKKYKGIALDHPEMAGKIFDTVSQLQNKFADNPYYKESIDKIMRTIANNERVNSETRQKAQSSITSEEKPVERPTGIRRQETNAPAKQNRPSVKEKAVNFIKDVKTKAYAGGKNLFLNIKNKMAEVAKENPKLFTAGGAAAMFAGIGTMNPELAAAGAVVMSAGVRAWSEKSKEQRGLSNNSTAVKQPKNSVRIKAIGNKQLKNVMRSR